MTAPRSGLLWLVGLTLIPAGAAAVAAPEMLWVGVLALVALVAFADWLASRELLAGAGVAMAQVTRVTKDVEALIELKVQDTVHAGRTLRLALAMPESFACGQEHVDIQLAAEAAWSSIQWPCTPQVRGRYLLRDCYLERASLLGLWSIRRRLTIAGIATGEGVAATEGAEIRVYPNVLGERKNVASLFLYRGDYGSHSQRMIGRGREFEKLREYVPGDDYGELHWRASAKHGRPIIKSFQIERTQEVYVILDASRLSARTLEQSKDLAAPEAGGEEAEAVQIVKPGDSVLERYVGASLIMALAAQRQGDLFGTLAFSNGVDAFTKARGGAQHYRSCREALYTVQPRLVSPDFSELFTFLRLHLRRRALLVFLTSLDDPVVAENFCSHVSLISRQHLVLVNCLRPAMAQPIFGEDNVQTPDDIYRRLGGHYQWQRLGELSKVLHRKGVSFHHLENENLCGQLVTQYMTVKRKQAL